MVCFVVSKNEEDPIKNDLDAQGQSTLKSVMESCLNSTKLLWLVLLPARLMKIHPKMKGLEWLQKIFHCKSMGIFQMLKCS